MRARSIALLLLPFVPLAVIPTLAQQAALPPAAAPAAAPAAPVARGPALLDESGRAVPGVSLSAADVRAVVRGPLAQATVTLTFSNSEARVLGGELVFPLPEGATVTGYALEVNGLMVDGVAVEKQQARMIYEKEMHKGVDPGLVEQAAGNAFRTRLYPVPARGSRSIRVQYVAELNSTRDGATLPLPTGWGGAGRRTVQVEAPDAQAEPAFRPEQAGLRFEKADRGFAARGELREATQELAVALPPLAARSVSVEKRQRVTAAVEDLEERAKGGDAARAFERFEHYFLLTDTPPAAPAAAEAKEEPEKEVHRVAVLWDAGLTRASADKSRELKLLDALLKRWPHAAADLVVFRDTREKPVTFDLANADGRGQMIETISRLSYDGAADLGHLPLPRGRSGFTGEPVEQAEMPYDMLLLFTDGMGGVGPESMQKARPRVYAFSDEATANGPLLRRVCRDSGGAYFNLRSAAEEQVLSGVGREPYALLSVQARPEEVAEVFPAGPVPVRAGGRVAVSGRLLAPEATVTLNYGYGGRVTHSERVALRAADAAAGDLVPRFWAQQKVAELSLDEKANAEELAKVGRQFNLVTANTSLLVLETADQYVQYRVVPPQSQPQVYREFMARIEQNKAQERQTKEEKLQQVLAMWDGRVKWWEQQFNYPKDFKVSPEQGNGRVAASGGVTRDAPATAPALGQTVIPEATLSDAGASPRGPVFGNGGNARRTPARPASPPPSPAAAASPAPEPNQATGQSLEERRVRAAQFPLLQSRLGSDISNADVQAQAQSSVSFNGFTLDKSRKDAAPSDIPAVSIKPWDPSTPYLSAMRAAGPEKAYAVFLEQRKAFGSSPSFYLDCGDWLERAGRHAQAVRVLTDVAALRVADARLLRVAGHRLEQAGELERAAELFERVLSMRPEEPQSYRDLALALAARSDALAALPRGDPRRDSGAIAAGYGRCLSLLNRVVTGTWDRFQEIELPCLMEANRVVARLRRMQAAGEAGDVPVPLDPRLVRNLECDLRVSMTWDADNTDVDLWVTEPSGEKCFYGHNRTAIGGLLSRDFTDGYGPEEYCLRRLMPGRYSVQCNFYGSRQQELTGPATVQATVFTDFGRPTEQRHSLTLRLADAKEVVDIGAVELGGKAPQVQNADKVDDAKAP